MPTAAGLRRPGALLAVGRAIARRGRAERHGLGQAEKQSVEVGVGEQPHVGDICVGDGVRAVHCRVMSKPSERGSR